MQILMFHKNLYGRSVRDETRDSSLWAFLEFLWKCSGWCFKEILISKSLGQCRKFQPQIIPHNTERKAAESQIFDEHKPSFWPWSFPYPDELIKPICLSFGLNAEENISVNYIRQCRSQTSRCNSVSTKDNKKKTEETSLCILLKNVDKCAGSKVGKKAQTATTFQVLLSMTPMGSQGKKQCS